MAQHLGELELARVQVEPPDCPRHDIGGQDTNRKLVLFAQPLGQGRTKVAARKAHFVSQCLGSMIEIGKVIAPTLDRSEEHTSELQALMRISYAVCCLKQKQQGELICG